jgi:hypothetical protein
MTGAPTKNWLDCDWLDRRDVINREAHYQKHVSLTLGRGFAERVELLRLVRV